MTEQIKKTIKILEDAKRGIERWDMTEWYDIAICSLQAWEEVLTELEHEKQMCFEHDSDEGFVYARAIDIINQHLAEIEK